MKQWLMPWLSDCCRKERTMKLMILMVLMEVMMMMKKMKMLMMMKRATAHALMMTMMKRLC